MYRYLCVAVLGAACVVAPRVAFAQDPAAFVGSPQKPTAGSIDGFGGLSVNRLASFVGSSTPVDFGAHFAFNLTPNVQAVGEVGRIGNLLPPIVDLPLSFTPIDVRMPAFYGEAGVRVLGAPRSAVNPYVEGSAGFARLDFRIDGSSVLTNVATSLGLSVIDRTDPIASVGGGVLLHGGPVLVDLGYRYKQIIGNGMVESLVGAGHPLQSHQLRIGVGVRF
jgi:hypothetical protein